MKKYLRRATELFGLILFIGALALLAVSLQNADIHEVIKNNRLIGAFLFACIMFSTTVVAPLTSLPLVPVVAPLLGPFTTGVASFLGWFAGALTAFVLGRKFGRPFILKFIATQTLARYEAYVKPETHFVTIVVLRMLLPVDILSYLLGAFSQVSFHLYAIATALGILWFSFAFAYLGSALITQNYVLLVSISVASVVILYSAWQYLQNMKQK